MNAIIETNETDFDREVLQSTRPALVDFWAPWCGPCKMMAPVLESVAAEQPGVKIVKVNVDENPTLAGRYDVQAIPTLLYFVNGELRERIVGAVGRKRILQTVSPTVVAG